MLSPAVLRSEWTVLGCRLASALNTVPRDAFHLLGDGSRHLVFESEHFPRESPLFIPDRGQGQIHRQACRLAARGGQYPRVPQTGARGDVSSIALSKRGYYRKYPVLIHPVPMVK